MSSSVTAPNAIFFGLVEALAFLCLFLSALLPPTTAPYVWLAIPLLRWVAFTPKVLPSLTGRTQPAQNLRELLREGWLYQVPFWAAALLFPLQNGQVAWALYGLFLQLGLLGILALLVRERPPIGGLTLLYLATLAWLCLWRGELWWLAASAAATALTLRWSRRPSILQSDLLAERSLAFSAAWLALWVLPFLTANTGLTPLLSCWIGLYAVALILSETDRVSQSRTDGELPTPGATSAQAWLLRRRSVQELAPWLAFVILGTQSPTDLWQILLLGLSWQRGSFAATRGGLSGDRAAWWLAAEFSILWGFWATPAAFQPICAACLVLCSAVYWRAAKSKKVKTSALSASPLAALEPRLRQELRLACPAGFVARVLEEDASVEIEKDLTATAPAGFRQRLLDRLRQDQDSD